MCVTCSSRDQSDKNGELLAGMSLSPNIQQTLCNAIAVATSEYSGQGTTQQASNTQSPPVQAVTSSAAHTHTHTHTHTQQLTYIVGKDDTGLGVVTSIQWA